MKSVFGVVLGAFVIMASPVLALFAQASPKAGDVALVLALPWGPPIDDILIQTGLQDIHPERAPLGAFVIYPEPTLGSDLMMDGPWVILNGGAILELC